MVSSGSGPLLRKVHTTGTRARLRLDTPPDPVVAQSLADALAGVPGIERARVRPNTGSVILEADGPIGDCLDAIEAAGIARIAAPLRPPPVAQTLQLGMLRGDMIVKERTEGALDLRTAMALALVAGAVLQLSRGKVSGPATTLFFTALSLIDRAGK